MPTTLSDIAREAGVSKMTVSRAINNHPRVSIETRERILKVAGRLNYKPNRYARALRTNSSKLIGIVVPDLMHSFFADISRGVEEFARPAGYQNVICNTEENTVTEISEVEALLTHTDGLIVTTALPVGEAKFYRRIIKNGANVVLIDRYLEGLRCPVVKADDVLAGFLATKHLIKLGHKRIGHLYGPGTSNANDRLKGYRSALEQYGLSFDVRLVRTASYPYESSSYEVMRIWLNEAKRPTALFAFNDPSGIGATRAVEDAGLRVPGDVAIVGCGNIHYGELLRVPLTTVSWSAREMGQVAAKRLIEMIEGSGSVANRFEEIVLRPEMVVRSSCGAAKKVLVASERG